MLGGKYNYCYYIIIVSRTVYTTRRRLILAGILEGRHQRNSAALKRQLQQPNRRPLIQT